MELLVVIGVITILIGLLIPAVNKARRAAQRTQCLSNLRNMQIAHWNYVVDNRGYLIQAGLAHGGGAGDDTVAWITVLQKYYGPLLMHRCPSDSSDHWEGGSPVPPTTFPTPLWRRTSYGINNFLSVNHAPVAITPYVRMDRVRRPAAIVQFLEMAYTGDFAGSDHPHVENWVGATPYTWAATMLQIDAHGNRGIGWEAVANYGFLDGHAESARFRDVYPSSAFNRFNPARAGRW